MGNTALSRESIGSYYGRGGFDNDTERGFVYSGTAVLASSTTAVSTGLYPGASGGNTIFFGPAFQSGNSGPTLPDNPPYTFQIANINTAALTSPELTFGLYAPAGSAIATLNAQFTVEFSADGTNYSPASYVAVTSNTTPVPNPNTGNFTFNQYRITSTIPLVNNLRVRFTRTAGNTIQYRLDDVALTAAAAPTINVSPTTLIFNNTGTGTQSAPQTVTVSGQNLTSSVVVTAPSGYLIRTGSNAYGSSLTLPASGGSVASTVIEVVFAPTAAQTFNGAITFTSNSAQTRTVAVSGTGVAPAPVLTVSPTVLPDFGTVQVSQSSAPQSFTVSGSNLSNPVVVTPPTGFQIRQGTNNFSTAPITLTPTNGTLGATSIDVRFVPTQPGTYQDQVLVTSGGAQTAGVDVSGTATPPPSGPFIVASPTTLDFGTISGSGSGAPQTLSFQINAGNLTAPLVLTGSSNNIRFRDATSGGSFTNGPLVINPTGGTVSQRVIEVQLVGPVPAGAFAGNITATSSGGTQQTTANPVVINITANNSIGGNSVINTTGTLQQFSTVPGVPSAAQSYQLGASNLVQDVTVTAPQYFQVSLDPNFTGLTTTGNSIIVARNAGNDINPSVTVYIRFVPPSALTSSSLIINSSSPAVSQGISVSGTSEPQIQILNAFQPTELTVINTLSATQTLNINAERVRVPITISYAQANNPLNPSQTPQFELSTDNVNFSTSVTLTPNQGTYSINQPVYVRYRPTYLGNAQATLQFQSNDFSNQGIQAFSNNNLLSGRSLDVEPTQRSTATVSRSGNTATVQFSLPPNYAAAGFGEGRVIVVSTSAQLPASSQPADGRTYNTGNQTFGQGDQIAPGYYVVYSGANIQITIDGLNPATTYYFYTFEFNNIDNSFNISVPDATNYLQPPVPNLIPGIEAPGNPPLPVSLVAFSAKLRNKRVELNWETASELNNKGFEVQRSRDGRTFETILTREGKGTTSVRTSYEAVDNAPLAGTSYYRLKQVDVNGKSEFSAPVSIANLTAGELKLYPNPVHEQLTIEVPGSAAGVQVQITDMTGRVIRKQVLDATGRVSMSELQAGSYLITVGEGASQVTRRVIKD
ncbi:T9SS type A sorting domain-containing protein [Hymenobacter weizhouensis]|uniref:T9SS type A sorting domain-containing protein n=1 Tax=Hymenobacter sp. YIM 151500-1 TaxID=2987689 RepID=UPI002226941D|nr:T9SS type A sorting domain-containing protein [Hymenobacter sp. YIM 151500-1]UYZ63652.1 T9SS type A sorting domain-containing protein [Hymenobacter sp. YIM 151500-1]